MQITVATGEMRGLMAELEGDIAAAATTAMRTVARDTVLELRSQVTSAGLGQRLANTWRDRVYPLKRRSITPAGYVWSNAPDIIDSYIKGATIRPHGGKRFLWIPTDNVPRRGGRRGSTKLMTPDEVGRAFDQDLIVRRARNGRFYAYVSVVRGRRAGTFRRSTAIRLSGRKGLAPRASELVLMFTLVPAVRIPKLLDLDKPAERGAARFEAEFMRLLADR